jgi:hypothetical protein
LKNELKNRTSKNSKHNKQTRIACEETGYKIYRMRMKKTVIYRERVQIINNNNKPQEKSILEKKTDIAKKQK